MRERETRNRKNPRRNVLCVRLNDEELGQVETIVKISGRGMSDIMRDVIGLMARIVADDPEGFRLERLNVGR